MGPQCKGLLGSTAGRQCNVNVLPACRRANEGVDVGALHERLVGLREMMFPHMLLEESLTKPAALQAAGFNERELAMFA